MPFYQSNLYVQLQRAVPLPIKNLAKFPLDFLDAYYVGYVRRSRGLKNPIPPMRLRALNAGRYLGHFLSGADGCLYGLEAALAVVDAKPGDFRRVLDFGCGCGRQIYKFADFDIEELNGCDINRDSIQWLRENYPKARFELTEPGKGLPYADEYFDLVYSVSTFSHFGPKPSVFYLRELSRIIRPGGICILTIEGQHSIEDSMRPPRLEGLPEGISLEAEKRIFIPYESEVIRRAGIKDSDAEFGAMFFHRSYIFENWSEHFEVIDILEHVIDNLQDAVIMKKR